MCLDKNKTENILPSSVLPIYNFFNVLRTYICSPNKLYEEKKKEL